MTDHKTQDATAMLKLLAQSERDVAAGRVIDHDEVFRRLEEKHRKTAK